MIGSIKGQISHKSDKFIILDTGNIGYKVHISPDTLSKIEKVGGDISLWTHTHVREDALDLYGFETIDDLSFFEMLINVSGIGPKGALTILGVAGVSTIKKAISTGDTTYLTKISGIGRKTAEKMIIELRDKVGKEHGDEILKDELDALEALKALGYREHEARDALKQVTPNTNTNTKLKEALKILSSK